MSRVSLQAPSSSIYVCIDARDYERVATICAYKYEVRAIEEGPWSTRAVRTLRNWIVALIKSQQFEEAQTACRYLLNIIIPQYDMSGTPVEFVLLCLLTSCLILADRHDLYPVNDYYQLVRRCDERSNMTPCMDWTLVREELEALDWVYHTKHDHLVLRDSQDGLHHMLAPIDGYSQATFVAEETSITIRKDVKSPLDQLTRRLYRYLGLSTHSARSARSASGSIGRSDMGKFEVVDYQTWYQRYGFK